MRSLTRPALAGTAALTLLAGYVDGAAFVQLGGYFVSFMTGNTTRTGVALAEGSPAWWTGLALVGLFLVGVVLGALLPSGRRIARPIILLVGIAVLCFAPTAAALFAPSLTPLGLLLLAVAMGALNTFHAGSSEVTFGITYMTGALVKLGQSLAGALRGGAGTVWLRYLILWVAIASGAIGGAVAADHLGPLAFAPAAAAALVGAIIVAVWRRPASA